MAKIIEEHVVIKVSYLVKTEQHDAVVTDEIKATIESVVGELIGDKGIVVEVINE